ncbi:MAG: 16S rRNA (guanine(966)-N(2))-methyltransferase RsmD [Chloroflexota bacterium]
MADAGRVIGGVARGVRLRAPGEGTRPFGDRVKESLFGALEADTAEPLGGAFLDLYAGSGAAGIEALSRGAPSATFVERDAGAVRVITENLRRAALEGGRVVRAEALGWLSGAAAGGPHRCVIADPPYADDQALARVLGLLGEGVGTDGILEPGGVVVCKHHWRWEGPQVVGRLARERTKRFGETALTWYRALDG